MDGVAVKPLTVSFHEGDFLEKVNQENTLGFWFQLDEAQQEELGNTWGPENLQALNRYSYVLNNPLKYTDPSGHNPYIRQIIQVIIHFGKWMASRFRFSPVLPNVVAKSNPFAVAKAGGRHAGLLKQYLEKSTRGVQKAMRSYEKVVQEHLDKLANPEKFATDWASKTPEEQLGLLRKWQKDIERNQELMEIMRGILRERGVVP